MDAEVGAPARLEGKFAAILVCWLLGIGCLFAWNSMLTIEDYYAQLFPKYHPARVLTLVYQPCALMATAAFAYNEAKIDTRKRNLFGFFLYLIGIALVLVLDLATSGRGGLGHYIGICVCSGLFGVADGHVQGGMMGDLSFMLPEFVQSFLAGMAASGALTSALRLFTKAIFDNSNHGLRKGAIMFFVISVFFELLCCFLYAFVFPKLPIVRYYRKKAASEGSTTVASDLAAGGVSAQGLDEVRECGLCISYFSDIRVDTVDFSWILIGGHWIPRIGLMVSSLQIKPLNACNLARDDSKCRQHFRYVLVLIAMYNVWDLIGRYVPLMKCTKLESRKGLLIVILMRFLLVPPFYFAAKYGGQGWMLFLTSFLGLTNGYLTVCVLISAPKGYKGPEQNALGNILALFLIGGIFAGGVLDWLWLIGKGW
nr:equilibrative nucleotide transporter 3 [Ipomoea batatas]